MIAEDGLAELEARLKKELEFLAYPDKDWVRASEAIDDQTPYDCAIVGAGQVGLSIACGLKRERINNIILWDESPDGYEGPWMTYGRMRTLRTPKLYSGPENGIPSLTFRAWYEAQHGQKGWDALFRVPRTQWMEYLRWYRRVLALPVDNDTIVTNILPYNDSMLQVELQSAGKRRISFARTVVIATGPSGVSEHFVPEVISNLPRNVWRHTNEVFDMSMAQGKRVGVLGAGASAFDNAIAAIEAGARSVDICFRRDRLPQQNPRRFLEFSGFLSQYPKIPDDQKWQYMHHLYKIGQPPPVPTFERALSFAEVNLKPGYSWQSSRILEDGTILIETPKGEIQYDFLIAGTGIRIDLSSRSEFSEIMRHTALWSDRYSPPDGLQQQTLSRFPYLGRNGQLTEKSEGTAPWLKRIFMMSRGSTLSLGPTIASNSALRYATPMIVSGVMAELFMDDAGSVLSQVLDRSHDELTPDILEPTGPA